MRYTEPACINHIHMHATKLMYLYREAEDDTTELDHLEEQPPAPNPTYTNYGTNGNSSQPPAAEESIAPIIPPRLPTRRYKEKHKKAGDGSGIPRPQSGVTKDERGDTIDRNIQVHELCALSDIIHYRSCTHRLDNVIGKAVFKAKLFVGTA